MAGADKTSLNETLVENSLSGTLVGLINMTYQSVLPQETRDLVNPLYEGKSKAQIACTCTDIS